MIKLNKKILYKVCEPATFENPPKNQVLANELVLLMKKKKAIGLAANQVGKDIRLFVLQKLDGTVLRCFNPSIVGHNEHYEIETEGCLSFPGEFVKVPRLTGIRVNYYNESGEKRFAELYGLEARCFQHELDHLNGLTMHDQIEGAV